MEEKEGDHLIWLNTVSQMVSGDLCDSTCFKLDKQTWQQKSKRQFLNIYSLEFWDILQNFSFHCILSNENFKMEDLWHV